MCLSYANLLASWPSVVSEGCQAARKKGTMVTYGGLSKQNVSVPTSAFIFSDITARGFWLSGKHSRRIKCHSQLLILLHSPIRCRQ